MSSTDFEPSGGDPAPSPGLLVEGSSAGGFEHPLTAATTAMLNINGANDPDGPGGFNVFYDIYGKAATEATLLKASGDRDIWSPVTPKLHSNGDMAEVFVSSPLGHTKLSSVLRSNAQPKLKLSSTDGGVIVVKEELGPPSPSSPSSRLNGLLGVGDDGGGGGGYSNVAFATLNPTTTAHYVTDSYGTQFALRPTLTPYTNPATSTTEYYRDYFPPDYVPANATRVISGYDGPNSENNYRTPGLGPYKNPVTIDVNSPDSGIGGESITPRDHSSAPAQPGFDYGDMVGTALLPEGAGSGGSNPGSVTGRSTPAGQSSASNGSQKATRPWHEFGRSSETDKIQIPKLFLSYGFRYFLESPISTSQRREDDRITYINKGQFYGITLDFIPDQEKPLKSSTVKSVVMLVFREEKSPEDEIKAWQFWHSRQHSVKQRILDADTKNSVGLVGCIDEVAHNAIAVYWNPLESSAKINVAVQCLSTDFSSQKGVKGLPLHLQIDTYDDPRDPNCPIYHRGYSQIKVFCDKGAERKTRDEERRAAKRKLTATGRKKLDELYHTSCDRTEFYAMSDLSKPPVLFSPAEDLDKVNLTPLAEFHGYYGGGAAPEGQQATDSNPSKASAPSSPQAAPQLVLKFHHSFPQEEERPPPPSAVIVSPRHHPKESGKEVSVVEGHPGVVLVEDMVVPLKRLRTLPPPAERLMIYVRQEGEQIFTPVHLLPPTTLGLLAALEDKFKISMGSVKNLFRRSSKGVVVKVDDDMLKHYCHEDTFLLEVKPSENDDAFDVTLAEIPSNS